MKGEITMDKFELLKKYKDLLDEGVIEQEEFEKKKKELMELSDEKNSVLSKLNSFKGKSKRSELSHNPNDEDDKTFVYEQAVELLKLRKSKKHKKAIEDLKTLGDWKDSIELIEQSEIELADIEEEEKRNKLEKQSLIKQKLKKVKKIVGIVLGIIVLLLIALIILYKIALVNLDDIKGMNKQKIHGIEYAVPESWNERESDSSETQKIYTKNKNDDIIAILTVEYTGESDLTSGDAAYTDEHISLDVASTLLPECSGTYQEVKADHSVFEITVYAVDGTVEGTSELIDAVVDSFNTEEYKNPRKSLKVDIEYTGSGKAGEIIDSNCDDITVTETFDTGVATGKKEHDWSVEEPVTLKAGQTSSVTIDFDGKKQELEIACVTLTKAQYKEKCVSRNYKNQLREESFGEYIKIYGKVLQDCGGGAYRISSSGGYDDVYMVYVIGSDIVEDDWVSIYGVTSGIYEYETVLGASKKIPSILAEYVER